MKICPKCNTGNSDNALKCKECEAYIGKIEVTESSKIVDEFNMKEKRREKIKQIAKIICIAFIIASYVLFFIVAFSKEDFFIVLFSSILCVIIGYLNIFHPEILFRLKYFTVIDNIDDVEPSDIYLLSSKLAGVLLLLIGTVIVYVYAFFPL
ncbi:DUF6199 family natural product biosynthesis protein [Acetivibrio clariflavus]|nr:DUF6199 family natural product biosynthesis protein [Acetivibrio clariflavus]